MKKLFIILPIALLSAVALAQNVGIGTSTPSEKLDVNGNINVTGNIKANGTVGAAGQVLMKNNAGTFNWANIAQYNNTIGFRSSSATTSNTLYSWTVPAGVTKLMVECWGGGGGGASGGGGGGGGYAASEWAVTAGSTVSITIGAAGIGAASGGIDAGDGNSTIVQINTLQLLAYGGEGGHSTIGGIPGRFSTNSTALFVYGQSGTAGEGNAENYGQYNATIYFTSIYFGSGGQGGNTLLVTKNGGFRSYNNSTAATIKNVYSQQGAEPAGGGGGDAFGGKNGGPGQVIIHY